MKVSIASSVRPPLIEGARPPHDWSPEIAAYVHDVKVAIIEALDWIGGPLSATELWLVLGPGHYEYQTVLNHVRSLAKRKCIEQVDVRPARGSEEKYFVLSRHRDLTESNGYSS